MRKAGALQQHLLSCDICCVCDAQAAVFLGFAMPAAYTSPEAAVLTKLFARLLADALNELAYPASLAGADLQPVVVVCRR
jgi:secreted Zn-dependent insulinase-like peptidase